MKKQAVISCTIMVLVIVATNLTVSAVNQVHKEPQLKPKEEEALTPNTKAPAKNRGQTNHLGAIWGCPTNCSSGYSTQCVKWQYDENDWKSTHCCVSTTPGSKGDVGACDEPGLCAGYYTPDGC